MSIMTKVTDQVRVLANLKQGFALDTRSHPTAVSPVNEGRRQSAGSVPLRSMPTA